MSSSPQRGRGATSNPDNRYTPIHRTAEDDGWQREADAPLHTVLHPLPAKSLISYNNSPDIPFSRSINPYQGCEHGCVYCYARPSHAYWGYSPGLDFETQIIAKPNAAELLRKELAKPGYVCEPVCIGANTDAYQPAERELQLTRQILQVLDEHHHPTYLITKNALVERDIDVLARMAERRLVKVMISVTTLDKTLARHLEPRASTPARRLEAIAALRAAGIPVGVLVAPVIPALTDHEAEAILSAVAAAGAQSVSYILLRLPLEVAGLFRDWLQTHYPDRASHVMSLVQQMRGGQDYRPGFGQRMRGEGIFAELLAQRFALARKRLGLDQASLVLDCSQFKPPGAAEQLSLF
ncbi:PA0069 family radical SAM protein [Parachitinimonas caeni]|uniref:PA0069 family radical SAM protein n=1 Tax=Parachitinimonas caeni TaxID=3031301 RepID=A0ABT7DWI6_9NEIS|nr:PA0069 family radical SAM protein [Parachitinimonas caeni]MDK2123012.1 PA0069 family radical SAM protein [Parachitinimonas caeni]